MRFVCLRTLALTTVVAVSGGCDLLEGILGGTPEEEPTPGRRPPRDDDEDEEEPAEGEGEGEGEEPIPGDTPPHPDGADVISFTASSTTLDDDDTVTLTVVVSDPSSATTASSRPARRPASAA